MSTLLYKYLVEAVATMFPPLYLLLYGAKSGSVHYLPEENHSWQWRKATQAKIFSCSSSSNNSKKLVTLASLLAKSAVTWSRSSVPNSTFFGAASPCFCVGMSVARHNNIKTCHSIFHPFLYHCNIKRVLLLLCHTANCYFF